LKSLSFRANIPWGKGLQRKEDKRRRFDTVRGECAILSLRRAIDIQIDAHACSLREDVADLTFEFGVESAAEMEHVLVCLQAELLKQEESGRFADEPAKIKFAQAHS
jgi:hypothetical protein